LKALGENGFVSVPSLVSPEEALRLRAILELLFARRAGEQEGAYGELTAAPGTTRGPNSPQIRLPVDYAPELHKSECFTNALAIAKEILGEDARFSVDVAIMKCGIHGAPTPWHQDLAFRDPTFEYREVTIWVALQDSDETSGCLMFLPGTHRDVVLEHRRPDDGASIALECVGSFEPTRAVAGVLPLGGCTIHFPGTLHCSAPNVSPLPRIAYIMTFGLPPKLAKAAAAFSWREENDTQLLEQRRRWLRRGGFLRMAWRRIRRGDVRDWSTLVYWVVRAARSVTRGG
jgi:ectoine hydroxylase-related dioxygenase (phytanoyl-CoA dioxygenase family)